MMNLGDGDSFSLIAKKEDTHLQFRLQFKETSSQPLKRKIEVTGTTQALPKIHFKNLFLPRVNLTKKNPSQRRSKHLVNMASNVIGSSRALPIIYFHLEKMNLTWQNIHMNLHLLTKKKKKKKKKLQPQSLKKKSLLKQLLKTNLYQIKKTLLTFPGIFTFSYQNKT